MEFSKDEYIRLVRKKNHLKNQKKNFAQENKNEYLLFIKYRSILYEELLWKQKDKIISLIENFLNKKIDSENFRNEVFRIREEVRAKRTKLESDFLNGMGGYQNVEINLNKANFSNFFNEIFIIADCYEDEELEKLYTEIDKELFLFKE